MSGLVLLVEFEFLDKLELLDSYKNGYVGLLVFHLLPLVIIMIVIVIINHI